MTEENQEIILQDILELYGYDFTQYSKASIYRRISRLYEIDNFKNFKDFQFTIRNDREYLARFIEEVTVNVTEMFRDPSFFKSLRKSILPALAHHPIIRIWHAGCATGEEVFSMCIILKELNLLHKSIIYATDINGEVLKNLVKGHIPVSQMKSYSKNYIESGGTEDFSSYYTANYSQAVLNKELLTRMVCSTHNLVQDSSFVECNLILCRNVLIYFDKSLQDRSFKLFDKSLSKGGYLCLGSKETLNFSEINKKYSAVVGSKIWRKEE